MKKFAIIFIVTLIYPIKAYCQHLYNQGLGGVAFIIFPDTPKVRMISSEKFYTCDYNKSRYIASAMPLTSDLRDLIIGDDFDSLYNNFLNGERNKIKGTIIYKGKVTIDNLNGFEFGCKLKSNGRTYFSYQRLLYLNDILINYTVLTADSLQRNDKKIAAFFKTFKITITEEQIKLRNAAKLGHIVGKLIVFIVGIGLVVLIVFGLYSTLKN
jgi:hypothetical protein